MSGHIKCLASINWKQLVLYCYNVLYPFIASSALFIDLLLNEFLAETELQCTFIKVK